MHRTKKEKYKCFHKIYFKKTDENLSIPNILHIFSRARLIMINKNIIAFITRYHYITKIIDTL